MKPAPFSYHRARSVDGRRERPGNCSGHRAGPRGGQSLVPMLNLRLVLVDLVVDLGAIAALKVATETPSSIRYGALLPHVAFEHAGSRDASNGLMPLVAAHIAYRAVRTAGRSVRDRPGGPGCRLAHGHARAGGADRTGRAEWPADHADRGFRHRPLFHNPRPAELIEAVEVPRRAATERWGRCKVVRKTGEYAESMAIAVIDRARRDRPRGGRRARWRGRSSCRAQRWRRWRTAPPMSRRSCAASWCRKRLHPAQLELHSNVALRKTRVRMKMGDMKIPVALTVNRRGGVAHVEPRTSLADFLREQLRLTAIHLGCEHGVCGACTVLINGTPARSCIALAVALEGADVRTLEGLAADPVMRTIKDAFHQEHGLQCGFCNPRHADYAWDLMKIMPDPRRRRGAGRNQRQSLPLYRVPRDRALDPASGRRRCGPAGSARGLALARRRQAKRTPFPLRFRFVPGSIPQCPAMPRSFAGNWRSRRTAGRREHSF
jgi:aerobic-type carbon monoxide dehydrogenase small subunit (CoxS/CutS family)